MGSDRLISVRPFAVSLPSRFRAQDRFAFSSTFALSEFPIGVSRLRSPPRFLASSRCFVVHKQQLAGAGEGDLPAWQAHSESAGPIDAVGHALGTFRKEPHRVAPADIALGPRLLQLRQLPGFPTLP